MEAETLPSLSSPGAVLLCQVFLGLQKMAIFILALQQQKVKLNMAFTFAAWKFRSLNATWELFKVLIIYTCTILVFCHASCFEGCALFRVSAKERKKLVTNKINALWKKTKQNQCWIRRYIRYNFPPLIKEKKKPNPKNSGLVFDNLFLNCFLSVILKISALVTSFSDINCYSLLGHVNENKKNSGNKFFFWKTTMN